MLMGVAEDFRDEFGFKTNVCEESPFFVVRDRGVVWVSYGKWRGSWLRKGCIHFYVICSLLLCFLVVGSGGLVGKSLFYSSGSGWRAVYVI